jgi:hypothetical protein
MNEAKVVHRRDCQKDEFCHNDSDAFCNLSAESGCRDTFRNPFQKKFLRLPEYIHAYPEMMAIELWT